MANIEISKARWHRALIWALGWHPGIVYSAFISKAAQGEWCLSVTLRLWEFAERMLGCQASPLLCPQLLTPGRFVPGPFCFYYGGERNFFSTFPVIRMSPSKAATNSQDTGSWCLWSSRCSHWKCLQCQVLTHMLTTQNNSLRGAARALKYVCLRLHINLWSKIIDTDEPRNVSSRDKGETSSDIKESEVRTGERTQCVKTHATRAWGPELSTEEREVWLLKAILCPPRATAACSRVHEHTHAHQCYEYSPRDDCSDKIR